MLINRKYESLRELAIKYGAFSAKVLPAEKIVVDERVRLKCQVPLCSGYGNYLTCPPFTIEVSEFMNILAKYKWGIIIQVKAVNINSSDKKAERISASIEDEIEKLHLPYKLKLLEIVEKLEAAAFKKGMRFAAGFIGGSCPLCKECIIDKEYNKCRHPFRARPAMEGVGIDVVETAKNAGLSIKLSSEEDVLWTGLVLLE